MPVSRCNKHFRVYKASGPMLCSKHVLRHRSAAPPVAFKAFASRKPCADIVSRLSRVALPFVVRFPVRLAVTQVRTALADAAAVASRWKATAIRQGEWATWFQEQMKTANKKQEKGLYISLRMDGRVRGSGVGSPPWERLAVSLPPVSGTLLCLLCSSLGF